MPSDKEDSLTGKLWLKGKTLSEILCPEIFEKTEKKNQQ
jgi:hypothetical protein